MQFLHYHFFLLPPTPYSLLWKPYCILIRLIKIICMAKLTLIFQWILVAAESQESQLSIFISYLLTCAKLVSSVACIL